MKPLPQDFDLAFRSADEIQAVQERLLAAHLRQCRRAPFYRKTLAGVAKPSLRRFPLEALRDLPLTTKADLEARNDDFLAVPPEAVRDIVQSSGTTGRPTRVMYTARDLERLAYNEAVCFRGCGMGPGDRVLLTCTLDRCFVAGYAYHLGAQAVGACTIRSGLNLAEGHAAVIALQSPTFVVGVPGFLRKLGKHLHDLGRPPQGIRGLICIGEPLRDAELRPTALSQDLERLWGAPAYSTYSSSEIVTSFCECVARCGGHAAPDLGIVEIVDADGHVLPPGQAGEVVVTPLGVEGMPLVRFRTGDVGYLAAEPCACGRQTPRLSPILGRRAQMLKIRGTTFYPATAFEVLNDVPEIGEYYLQVETTGGEDQASVHLSLSPDRPETRRKIEDRLLARLRVRVQLCVEPEDDVRRQVYVAHSRKPIRFIDRRGTSSAKA
ncbi:MAG: phenylacetate--CoA ligase family protein [Spartobacteria bacterium]|nr:phenylacetate--CoA ligase family protein [Spartobacteria bacterium]